VTDEVTTLVASLRGVTDLRTGHKEPGLLRHYSHCFRVGNGVHCPAGDKNFLNTLIRSDVKPSSLRFFYKLVDGSGFESR
jgi:hypothetical protein